MDESGCKCACGCGPRAGDDRYTQLDAIIGDHRRKPGALIPVLQQAQSLFGYLPEEVLRRIGEGLNEPYSRVFGVVTFYSFFSRTPRGRYLIRVCLGTACYVRGAREVLAALERELKIAVGQTTPDRVFSLDVGRCFGACGLAPAVMVNDDVHQFVTPEGVPGIIRQYRDRPAEKAVSV